MEAFSMTLERRVRRSPRLSCVLFSLALLFPPAARAQTAGEPDLTARLAAIEKRVEAKRQELHIPGVALAIVKDDRVIYSKGFGLRDMERKLSVTPEPLFAIGSCTKAFTAMTVMMSGEDVKLSLIDSPKKY